MISLIEVLNYRCLKHIRQELGSFHVLVGPNASGKTTFLDAIAFLGKFVTDGLDSAVNERSANFHDLVWRRGAEAKRFEIAVEAQLPEIDQMLFHRQNNYEIIRYEVSIGLSPQDNELQVLSEQVLLGKSDRSRSSGNAVPTTLRIDGKGWRQLIEKYDSQETHRSMVVIPERHSPGIGDPGPNGRGFLFPRKRNASVLSAFDETAFPASSWLLNVLGRGRERMSLDVNAMKKPCPPGQDLFLKGSGSNLPMIIKNVFQHDTDVPQYHDWLSHLKTALPDMDDIRIIERPEDRHFYLMIKYSNGMEVPSWMLSEGTLRLLALTIIPYVAERGGVWLVEEPENGIHPLNLETVMQSLSSVYDGQVLIATHSPAVLALAPIDKMLVFENKEDQGVRIMPGTEHPRLKEWRGEPSIGILFAGGVLG